MNLQEIRERLLCDESVREQITRRAFEIYASRGYVGGREFEDWLQAENEFLPQLIEEERQRMAMAQAALEPEVQREEAIPSVAQTTEAKGAAKAKTAKGAKKTTAKKASAQKSARKKTS